MRSGLKRWLPCIIAGLLTMVLFRTVLLIGVVPSCSMEPLIPEGSFLLADRTAYWREDPDVGDVIVFRRGGRLLVKRVAATGGQTVLHAGERIRVPDGCLSVLGDNQAASVDSADWEEAFVPAGDAIGRHINIRQTRKQGA